MAVEFGVLESEPGRGRDFHYQASEADPRERWGQRADVQSLMTGKAVAGPSAPPRVLVVEDEPEMRDLLADNLELEGYRVVAVGFRRGGPAADSQQAFVRADPAGRDAPAAGERIRVVPHGPGARRPDSDHHAHGQDRRIATVCDVSISAPTTT